MLDEKETQEKLKRKIKLQKKLIVTIYGYSKMTKTKQADHVYSNDKRKKYLISFKDNKSLEIQKGWSEAVNLGTVNKIENVKKKSDNDNIQWSSQKTKEKPE